MNLTEIAVALACSTMVGAFVVSMIMFRRENARHRRAVQAAMMNCSCDSPTCTRSPVCQLLGEYRITHRVISAIANEPGYGVDSIPSLLKHIECECEILVK